MSAQSALYWNVFICLIDEFNFYMSNKIMMQTNKQESRIGENPVPLSEKNSKWHDAGW